MTALDPSAFIASHCYGVLSSLSLSHPGYPFGSIVPYIVDDQGYITIYISELAEHSKNIRHDPRVSLTITDINDAASPASAPRITCLADAVLCEDQQAPRQIYARRFSDGDMILQLPGFQFYHLQLQAIRLIGGFGDIKWLAPDKLRLSHSGGG